jgi:glycosyltransferase involved in cell wall biosynthesis
MACGIPAIATNTDGSSEQILPKYNGFILPNDDEWLELNGESELNTIITMSESQYQVMSENAISSAQKHKLSAITDCLVNIYHSLG